MEKAAFVIYLIVLAISPILFGAVHTWVYTLVFLLILVASLLLLKDSVVKVHGGAYAFTWPKTGMLPLYIGFIVLLLLQMTPLPEGLLFWIAPEAKVVGGYGIPAGSIAGGGPAKGLWLTLAPYVYPVRTSLIQWIAYGLLFFGLVRTLNSRNRIETVIILILCLGVFESLYGIIELSSGGERMLWAKRVKAMGGVAGTYDSTNHFAGLMEMGIVLAATYAGAFAIRGRGGARRPSRSTRWKEKVLLFFSSEGLFTRRFLIIFAGVVMGIGLVLSKSRGGLVATAAALLFLGLFFALRKDFRRKGTIILALFLLLSGYTLTIGIDRTIERFKELGADYEIRYLMVQNTIKMFDHYQIAGVGVGNFRHACPRYQDPKFQNLSMIYAHNDWVQLLAEAGVIGMVLFIAGMGFYLFFLLRRLLVRHDPFAVCLGAASLAALVAMAIHAWSDFNLRIPANFMILTAVVAIGFCAVHLEAGKQKQRDSMANGVHRLPMKRGGAVILVLFLVVILWAGWALFRHFVAEAYCPSESNPTLKLKDLPPEDNIRRAMIWDRGNAAYPYKLARVLIGKEDQEAREEAAIGGTDREKAEKRDELQQGVIGALEEAVHLNPMNAEYHVRLGWEYTHLWYRVEYMQKWLPAADISMERAAHVAGGWAENPHLHLDMGNYWTMRSKSLPAEDPVREIDWTRALWHYHKALAIDGSKAAKEEIARFVKNFYPEEDKVIEAIEDK